MIQLLIEIESKIIEISDIKVTKDEDGGRYMKIMSIKLDVFRRRYEIAIFTEASFTRCNLGKILFLILKREL